MSATAQSQTIATINAIIQAMASMKLMYDQITALNAAWGDDGSLAILNAMTTAAQNTDGSQGANDTTPNAAHPLSLATYPALSRGVSPNQITSGLTQLNNIVSFINGNSLAATAGVRSVFNAAVGG